MKGAERRSTPLTHTLFSHLAIVLNVNPKTIQLRTTERWSKPDNAIQIKIVGNTYSAD